MYVAPSRCPCVLWPYTVETPAGATYKESEPTPNVLVLSVCLFQYELKSIGCRKIIDDFIWSVRPTPKVGLIRLVLPTYGINTDTCTHMLLNHQFINTAYSNICRPSEGHLQGV